MIIDFEELLEKATSFAIGSVPAAVRKSALSFLNVVLSMFLPSVDKKKEPVKPKVSQDAKPKEWQLVATTALNVSIKVLSAIDGSNPEDLIVRYKLTLAKYPRMRGHAANCRVNCGIQLICISSSWDFPEFRSWVIIGGTYSGITA